MNGASNFACRNVRAALGLERAGAAVLLARKVDHRAVLRQAAFMHVLDHRERVEGAAEQAVELRRDDHVTFVELGEQRAAGATPNDTSKSVNGIVPFTDLSLRSFYLLARPRTPETVRNKVLSKAATGPMKDGV